GTLHECRRDCYGDLFCATIGGMGLTGLILDVTIRLMKVGSTDVEERVIPFGSLEEYFELAAVADEANEYVVVWIDQLAYGRKACSVLLLTANHAPDGAFRPAGKPRLVITLLSPANLLNRVSIRFFNEAYRRASELIKGPRLSHFAGYFFPLDGVRHW